MEDQTIFREMFAELLRQDAFCEVVGEVSTGAEALEIIPKLRPNMVTVDLVLPDTYGLDILLQIRRQYPSIKVIVVTAQERPSVVQEVFEAGAHGIVTKTASLHELQQAIRHVAAGGIFYCTRTSKLLRSRGEEAIPGDLTDRESQIVRRIAMGQSSKEIASALKIKPKTVANHRLRIARKLGAGDIAGLTRYAIARGWVTENA